MGQAGQGGAHVAMLEKMSVPKPTGYEALLALPDNQVGEIVGGTLYASPRPAVRHALAASALGVALGGPFQFGRGGPGGWWILDEPELRLGQDVLVPDLAGWRKARLSAVPDEPSIALPPDWVCEVLSPSTAKLDLSLKLPRYVDSVVGHAWVVDPAMRALQVFDLRAEKPVLSAVFVSDDWVRAPPFEDVEIELGLLWGDS